MTNKCQFCNNESYGVIGYIDKIEYDDYYIKQGDNFAEFGYGSSYDFDAFIIDKKFFEIYNLDIHTSFNVCDACFTEKAKSHSKLVDTIITHTTDFYEWLFNVNDTVETKFKIVRGRNPIEHAFKISVDTIKDMKVYCVLPRQLPDDDVIFMYLWTHNTLDPMFLMLSKNDLNLPICTNYATIDRKIDDLTPDELNTYKYAYAVWINKHGKIEYTPPKFEDRLMIPDTYCLYKSDYYILRKDDNGYYLDQYKSDTETYERVEIDNIDYVITTFSTND